MDNATFLELHRSLLDALRSSGSLDVDVGSVTVLDEGEGKDEVADAPTKTLVRDRAGKPLGVLFVSNEVNPSLVGRSVQKAAEAKGILGADLGSVILVPLAEGVSGGLSYALWPWHRVLSSSRFLFHLQKRTLRSHVLSWLQEVAEDTRRQVPGEEIQARYVSPLEHVVGNTRLPEEMRAAARAGADRLVSGAWLPSVALQHGDFHVWNLLLWHSKNARPQGARPFIVVDWSGANINGYPLSDLVSFSSSARLPRCVLGAGLRSHCRALGCELVDATSYVVASLGFLGMNLEHFPEDRYRLMCKNALGVLAQGMREAGS